MQEMDTEMQLFVNVFDIGGTLLEKSQGLCFLLNTLFSHGPLLFLIIISFSSFLFSIKVTIENNFEIAFHISGL